MSSYRGTLGKLQMHGVHTLQDLLSLVHANSALLRQRSQPVPLVTDPLAPLIDGSRVPVVEGIQLLGDGGDLFNTILVRGQVGLEGLVLLLHGLQLEDLAVLVVGGAEHLLLARGPGLVDVGLVLELLGQMLQTLKAHELSEQPLLEALFGTEKSVPGPLDVRDHLALSRHVSRTVGQPQLGLQRVEVGLQFRLLLDAWRLVLPPVLSVLLELLLNGHQRVAGLSRLEPWQCSPDPFQKLKP